MTKATTTTRPRFRPIQRLQLMTTTIHDPYQSQLKLKEPSVCTECGVLYQHGRWTWGAAPAGAAPVLCPACRRTREGVPAGYVTIAGEFAAQHRPEVLSTIRNLEQREKREHPLQRIVQIETHPEQVLVTTTDVHLARGIGEALHAAFKGTLEFSFSEDEHLLYVDWRR